MRKLKKNPAPKLVHINKKVERRERVREGKAERIALIDNQIKKELLERLKQGVYGEIYNFRQEAFEEIIDKEKIVEVEEEQPPAFVADEYEEETGDVEDLATLMLDDDEEFDPSEFIDEFASEIGDNEGDDEESGPAEKRQRSQSINSTTSVPSNSGSRSSSPATPKRKRVHREIEYEKTTDRERQHDF